MTNTSLLRLGLTLGFLGRFGIWVRVRVGAFHVHAPLAFYGVVELCVLCWKRTMGKVKSTLQRKHECSKVL